MKKFLWILYQPYKWLVYIPFLGVNTIVFGTLAMMFGSLGMERTSDLCGILWARINTYMTPAIVRVIGKQHLKKGQSYVIVANHRSSFDILISYAFLGIPFKWVMKKELSKVPGLGYGSRAVGHIFIDRSNTKKAIDTMNRARAKIRNGMSVLFFPEGTRNEDGTLLPFKKGAFHFALDLNLPILPVSINGTDRILPDDTYNLFPGCAEIVFHTQIDTAAYSKKEISKLIEDVRFVVQSGLNETTL